MTEVNDSPFASPCPGPCTTEGVFVDDPVTGVAVYDDTTGQVSGSFISYELTSLDIAVPDDTQGGDLDLDLDFPVLNSATRIVVNPANLSATDGSWFQGLVLPNNVTGYDQVDAFGLLAADGNAVSFEAEGFNGPEFRFNLGIPVVEFPEPGLLSMLAAGTACLVLLGRKRIRL